MNSENENVDLEEDLFEHFRFDVPKGQVLLRIDKFLMNLIPNATRNKIQNAAANGDIYVNNLPVKSNYKVKPLDLVTIMLTHPPFENRIDPEDLPLDIVYEDDDLIVINKTSDMTVHPGAGTNADTLVNALLYHTKSLSDIGGEIRPGIVHRLDKTTSGLMVVAKNNQAHVHLAQAIETRELVRKYQALIWGILKPVEGVIDIPIGRSTLDRKKMSTLKFGGKTAITHYKTLEILCNGLFSIVECRLETGRTHQIRVHLSHQGHSIVGDQTYGNNNRKIQGCPEYLKEALMSMKHQALHSCYISFTHPVSGNMLEFEQDVPLDYTELIKCIRREI